MNSTTEVSYRAIFEKIPGQYLVLKPETYKILAASDEYLESMLMKRQDILGKSFFEVFPSPREKKEYEGIQKVRDSLKRVETEKKTDTLPVIAFPVKQNKSFENRWWSLVHTPVNNEFGDIDYIIHRIEDVTTVVQKMQVNSHESELQQIFDSDEFRLASDVILRGKELQREKEQIYERLCESEKQLKLAIEVSQLGTWAYDPLNEVVELDHRMKSTLGMEEAEDPIAFSEVVERVHPEDKMQLKRALRSTLAPTGDSTFSLEYRIRLDDGSIRWISANGQARFDSDESETATGFLGTAQDITQQKMQEKKLESMNENLEARIEERTQSLLSYQEQLRSLASQLSKAEEQERRNLAAELHDNLGQLLTVCKMKISELQNDGLSDSAAAGIEELSGFVDEAISYTRELMADLKPPPTIDEKNFQGVMNWVAKRMKKHGLNVKIENDVQPKHMDEDVRTTLLQSVRELLFNVVKHTNENEARLTLTRKSNNLQVIVEDQGKGFDIDKKEEAPGEDGGFGLFNIRERMDLLGGGMDIFSEEGKGTRVVLSVPLQQEEQPQIIYDESGDTGIPRESSSVQTELWQTAEILIVDDHEMVRRGLRKMIENQDDLVVTAEASNGEEAVKLARALTPDIIVMDVNLPGMDGIEATRKIVAEIPDVRIIGLSLHDENGVAEDMRNAGASAYLTKTEAFETLCATIRSEATMAKKNKLR